MIEEPKINRNLALELLRVTEAGALAAAPLQGRGNKEAADARAVEAIRTSLATVDMKGTVVIGEGEKDKAPMLYFGEQLGNGLDRERNKETIAQIRDVGARIKLISAGDVAAALEAALETRFGIHCMMGSGGATEGVLAACAIKTIGGDMQAKLHFRDDKEREMAIQEGLKPDKVLCIDDLCSGKDIFFAATGITSGELLKGVRYEDVYAYTQSMVLRSASGTMRIVDAYHPIDKLRAKGLLPEQVAIP